MCGLLNVRVKVWPTAADTEGLWLLADEPWLSAPIAQDSSPHWEVETLLADHGLDSTPVVQPVPVLHSPSWQPDLPSILLNYIAVAATGDFPVPVLWPHARPISPALLEAVGTPPTHAADGVPTPRDVDVLAHAIRHLRLLQEFDATAAAALPPAWGPHLARLRPALAGLYSTAHGSAVSA